MALGPWRWPKKIVPLGDVADARAEQVQPLRLGGWGYRVCGRGCRAIVVRRGEGLKLSLKNDRILIVTVDHAGEAAALINDLRTRN